MVEPTLSPRLMAIAAHIPAGARLADIGTDHAYLPVALARAAHIASAIAVDRRPGAVAQAARTVARHHITERVTVRLGDGLSAVRPGEVDTVVISGLGGPSIVRILAAEPAALQAVRRLILAPQSANWRVRRWLMIHGWAIVAEDLVLDGAHGYEIIVAEPGDGRAAYDWPGRPAALTASLLAHLGPRLARAADAVWRAHWLRLADGIDESAAQATSGGTATGERTATRHRRRAARIRAAVGDGDPSPA